MAFCFGNQPQLVGNALQCLCQLIGARGASTTAVDTFEASDGLVYLHTANECRNTLRIAVATADKLYRTHLAVLDNHINQLRTYALRNISSAFLHLHFVFGRAKIVKFLEQPQFRRAKTKNISTNLPNVKKCVSLQPLTSTGLSYGVMVTRQILVLKFWVRAPIAQHNKGRTNCSAAFVVSVPRLIYIA